MRPHAFAIIKGSYVYPEIYGIVKFYQTGAGVLVFAEVSSLPSSSESCKSPVFGFHIHSGDECSGDSSDPFSAANGHYDTDGCKHPFHAGDLPQLLGCGGYAFSVFLTGRFSLDDVVGKTVIIHRDPDDFRTQPSGGAGEKIACGVIMRNCP